MSVRQNVFRQSVFWQNVQVPSFEADSDLDLVKARIENCIAEIRRWMLFKGLKINDDKTISVLMHSKFRPFPSLDSIKVGNDLIPFSGSATNLGVIMMRHSPTMIMIRKLANPHSFI